MSKKEVIPQGKSVANLAAAYDVSRGFIYSELKRGNLKALKIGSRTIITAEQEAEWLASKELYKPEE